MDKKKTSRNRVLLHHSMQYWTGRMEKFDKIAETINTVYLDGELYLQIRAMQNIFARLNNATNGFERENVNNPEMCYTFNEYNGLDMKL